MKVLFLYSSMRKGGAERVIASLSNRFVQAGHSVTVAVLDDAPSQYELDARVEYLPLGIAHESNTLLDFAKSILRKLRTIRKVSKTVRPDVLVAFQPQLAVLAKLAVPRTKVIGAERSNPRFARRNFKEKLFVKLSPICDGFLFQTKGAQAVYPERTGEKSCVIPNGVFVAPSGDVLPASARGKRICATGSMRKVKRYDLLISAFAEFHRTHADYTLTLYGEGPQKSELETLTKTRGVQDAVDFSGNTSDVAGALCNHEIFVLASDYEGMPNGLMEALACGCACVSTDCDFGPRELIEDGRNGLLVPTGDADAICAALCRIADDSAFADALGAAAQEIRTTHDPEIIAKRFLSYFESVCKEP